MPKRYSHNDSYSQKAAEQGYRARSIFKLEELDQKFKLIHPGMTILDLGCAPGSWMQYCARKLKLDDPKNKGRIVGIDLQDVEAIEGVETYVGDMTDIAFVQKCLNTERKVDIVLSDAAPATSGIKDVDQWRSIELCQSVVEIALQVLKPGGYIVMKVFRGADFDEFLQELKSQFERVNVCTVKASRDRSKEVFVVCR